MRSRRLALASLHLVLPVLVALGGAWFSRCRTPIWVWADPDYAYLLNALSIAELAAPTHTQHPGTPAQELGAALLVSTHALHPAGFPSLREHVLSRPESFLRLWRSCALALYAAALAIAGLFIWRTTGSPAAGLLFQVTPLLSVETLFSLSRVQAEPVALALGAGAGAWTVALAADRATWDRPRTAATMGVLAGLGIATKLTFAPLLLVCLAVLSKPARGRFALAAVASCGIALIPTFPTLMANLRWYWTLLVHTGYYGSGSAGFVDLAAFPGNVWGLVVEEWGASVLGLMALVLGLWLWARRPPGESAPRPGTAALLACGVAQIVWLCVVAKHARARYLLPVVMLASIGAALVWHLSRRAAVGAAFRAATIVVALLALAGQPSRLHARASEMRQEMELRRQAADIVAAGAGRIIEATPVVSPAGALRYGQIFAPPRFGAELRRLYPGVTAWDLVSGINAFGAPADPARVFLPSPDGGASFRMVGVQGYPVVDSPPAGVILTPVRSMGRHALYEGRVVPCAGASEAAFAGFFDSSGLQWSARPEPLFLGSSPTRLLFTGNGARMTLALQVRPLVSGSNPLTVRVNGETLARPVLRDAATFEDATVSFAPRAGVNEALIEYGPAGPIEPLVPRVAFRRLQLRCASGR